jgi:hypothetical protein
LPVLLLWLVQHAAICPVMLNAVDLAGFARSMIVRPRTGSATRTAFDPGIKFMPNGRLPPAGGLRDLRSFDRLPSRATLQTAKFPTSGAVALLDTMSCVSFSLKMIWLAVKRVAFAGVIWFRLIERDPLEIAANPFLWSTEKQVTPECFPPLSAHRRVPALLKVRDTGNSPPEEIGLPISLIFDGSFGSIANKEIVFDPAYYSNQYGLLTRCVAILTFTVASTLPFFDAFTAPCEKSGSGPFAATIP